MPRNQSEKLPYPELPKAVHEYYGERVLTARPTSKSELLWSRLSREDQSWVRNHWDFTPEYKALKAYYLKVSNSDGA